MANAALQFFLARTFFDFDAVDVVDCFVLLVRSYVDECFHMGRQISCHDLCVQLCIG